MVRYPNHWLGCRTAWSSKCDAVPGRSLMETTQHGQVFYPQEADELVPEGCLDRDRGNQHGDCLGRGCEWCDVYYHGPEILFELRGCYSCGGEFGVADEDGLFMEFSDVGRQVVHESCYEAARDAWVDACRGEEAELRANYPN